MTDMYRQVARALEDDILSGQLREGDAAPSTSKVSERFQINPATAAKGVSLLTREGVLFKRRGIGLFVTEGARARVLDRRKADFRASVLTGLLEEARKLGISRRDLIAMIMAAP